MSTEDATFKSPPHTLLWCQWVVGKWEKKTVALILHVVLRGIIARARDGDWAANEASR